MYAVLGKDEESKHASSSIVSNKTIKEEQRQETQDQRRQRQQVDKTTRYYYLHIAKTGGATMARNYLPMAKQLFRVRDYRVKAVLLQHKNFTRFMEQQDPKVRVFVTEGKGFAQHPPPHSLTVFREPVSHVLSMYYHCTESRASTAYRRKTMKVRQDWLQTWDHLRIQHPEEFDPFSKVFNWTLAVNRSPHAGRFDCYVPVNYQSHRVGHDALTKQQLQNKFHVVGITDDLEGSACLFFVQVLQRVPSLCDCSKEESDGDRATGSRRTTEGNTSTPLPKKITQQHQQNSHGVKHHGDSSRKTLSDVELALIRNITQVDQKLYEFAKELFHEQVAWVEQTFKVTLCRKHMLSAKHGNSEQQSQQ